METAKHRVFQFLDGSILPDNRLIVFASSDAFHLGVLQSRAHVVWALAAGGTLEDRPIYTKSQCLDPFPFPVSSVATTEAIRLVAEEIDAHRKRVVAEHPELTLTELYNVMEKLRAGISPDALEPADRQTFDDGRVLILKELHDTLNWAVYAAYDWPADIADEDILGSLVALNKERAKEEARGIVRWLRPEYQVPRFGSTKEKAELDLVGGGLETPAAVVGPKPLYPTGDIAQTAAVMSALAAASGPLDAAAIAATFRQGRKIAPKVGAVLGALSRMGFVAATSNGAAFQLRRVA